MPEPLLRALDLTIARRVEGLLPGDHRSSLLGRGSELAQIRPYEPVEDDVRQIDWNVTARTGHAARAHPPRRARARDLARARHLAVDDVRHGRAPQGRRRRGRLARRRLRGDAPRQPPRPRHVRRRQSAHAARAAGPRRPARPAARAAQGGRGAGSARSEGAATSIGEALERVGNLARQRSYVVVVSDFRGPRDWRRPLLMLGGRHHVVAVEIRDAREQELPKLGQLRLVDPETGRQLKVDTSSERVARASSPPRPPRSAARWRPRSPRPVRATSCCRRTATGCAT